MFRSRLFFIHILDIKMYLSFRILLYYSELQPMCFPIIKRSMHIILRIKLCLARTSHSVVVEHFLCWMFAVRNNAVICVLHFESFFPKIFLNLPQKKSDREKKPNFVEPILHVTHYSRFFIYVTGLTAYTQFVSTTEIQRYVSNSFSAAKPYLLDNLKEVPRKLQQENSSLGTAAEQG